MSGYLVRRLALAVPTLLGISIIVFLAVRFIPGNVVDQLSQGTLDPATRHRLEQNYHLNGNVVTLYLQWAGGVLHGNFGQSFISNRHITDDLRSRLPVTIELGVLALVISVIIAVPTGVISALKPESALDHLCRSVAVLCIAVPSFWLGLLAITYGYAWFKWVPPLRYQSILGHPVSNLSIMAAPAIILGASLCGSVMRLTRSSVLEVTHQDYVRTARAKGLAGQRVVVRHILRNALIPVVTIIGLQVPVLLGGSVVLETIFSLPGMGSYLLSALQQRDYPTVQAVVVIAAVAVVATNLLVDLVYGLIDPRIRYGT